MLNSIFFIFNNEETKLNIKKKYQSSKYNKYFELSGIKSNYKSIVS